jgi:hypothetical protein
LLLANKPTNHSLNGGTAATVIDPIISTAAIMNIILCKVVFINELGVLS